MSLKGKPVCAQNWFGSLVRDPRKTQPWTAMQLWHWPHLSCLRTILWAGFCWELSFATLRTVGWGPWAGLSRVWRSSLEDKNANSHSGESSGWLCVHLLCKVISAAAPSPFEYPEPPAGRWFQAQLQSKTSEGVCLFRRHDFPGFPWISVLSGLKGSNNSSLFSALSFWCPAVGQRWLLVPWMNFLELSALNFPFSEVVFKMLHFCELFTDNFGAIKQSWVCCRKSQHKRIFSATDIFSTVLSSGFFSASVSSSQNKAIFHYYLFICTELSAGLK